MELLSEIYTTEGRLNRLRYFKYQIIWILIGLLIGLIIGFIIGDSSGSLLNMVVGLFSLFMGIGNIMLSVRRLHDLNKSGWFMLLAFVPLVNLVFALYLYLAPGQVGANQYGADPLDA